MVSLPLERARSLFEEGQFAAALSVFGDALPADPELLSACAEAMHELGRTDQALRIVEQIERANAGSPQLVARARRIGALVEIDRGETAKAIDLLRSAVSLAEAVGDYTEAARASLRLFTCLHHAVGRAESTQTLASTKRLVLKSSQPRLLADLYSRVGQAEAQSGNLSAAKLHLDRAVALLVEKPHYVLIARTRLALSSTLALLCRNDEATTEAKAALTAAQAAGSTGITMLCQANLAQLQFRIGAVTNARWRAKELLDSPRLLPTFRLAILETYVASTLESRQCTESSPELHEFLREMADQTDLSWIAVEAVPTQARVLEFLHGPRHAREALRQALEKSMGRHHVDSVCRLLLLDAEFAVRTGEHQQACERIVEATSLAGDLPSIDILCLLERSRGLLARGLGLKALASLHLGRAERVLRGCGLRTEAKRTRRARLDISLTDVTTPPVGLKSVARELAAASEGPFLARLASFPRLLAAELSVVVARQGLDSRPVVELRPRGAPTPESEGQVFCGQESTENVYLCFGLPRHYLQRQRLSLLVSAVRSAVSQREARDRDVRLLDFFDLESAPESKRGLYISPPMRRLLTQVRQVARTDLSVLVRGETGTGKEIVAQEIHAHSRRAHKPFIPFNVTAVPRDTLEGQLFGYRRGAFTGAVNDNRGLIREAEGGTLFLDEIGELSLDLQPKLLRFLESGEIQPLGERPQRVDVRIVAATNAHLDRAVKEGRFREDLYYRLNVVSLTIPPLRDRREEIPTLLNHFLTMHARDAGTPIPQLSPQALELLSAYDWPGNVRQLTNELKRIVALHDEDEIVDVHHLSDAIRQAADPTAPPAPADEATVVLNIDRTLQEMYDDLELAAIPRAMRLSRQNQTETARRLGITRKGLYLKRQRLGLLDEAEA